MACSANKKLVVFIVDDEPGPLQTLANDLKEMPEVGEVCTFSSYSDAVYPVITPYVPSLTPPVKVLCPFVPHCRG